MDSFHILSLSTVSFLPGCTVHSMSLYRVTRAVAFGDNYLKGQTAVPLGIGVAIGSVQGKELFKYLSALFPQPDMVGSIQSDCLLLVMVDHFFCNSFSFSLVMWPFLYSSMILNSFRRCSLRFLLPSSASIFP